MKIIPKYAFTAFVISVSLIALALVMSNDLFPGERFYCSSGVLVRVEYGSSFKEICMFNQSCTYSNTSACSPGNCSPCKHELFSCDAYKGADVCAQVYQPVCALAEEVKGRSVVYRIRDWGNPCSACINEEGRNILGYFNVSCSEI